MEQWYVFLYSYKFNGKVALCGQHDFKVLL